METYEQSNAQDHNRYRRSRVLRLADAQQAIFLVRHAEDVRSKDVVDRPLTESGQRRATLLASVLKDAGINAIFTSSLQRAVKTAEPLANRVENRAEASTAAQHKIRNRGYGEFRSTSPQSAPRKHRVVCRPLEYRPMLCSRRWDTRTR